MIAAGRHWLTSDSPQNHERDRRCTSCGGHGQRCESCTSTGWRIGTAEWRRASGVDRIVAALATGGER